ncbi:MAG: N-acetylmuramoyl-L-alanine amidase [Nitrospirota bacterium]
MLVFLPSFVTASGKTEITNIRYWSSHNYIRVVIDLSKNVEFTNKRLTDPDRLYFDLLNTTITQDINTALSVENGMLKTVRASQYDSDTVRVVLDIKNISDFNVFMLDDPARLVIDIYGKEEETKEIKEPDTLSIKRKIVIDAGHGGHDPGAIGPRGICEKDVVLDIALKLKEILLKNPLNEVFLTRETDVFIPLEERTMIANKRNADLFVSIHANASYQRHARGIETYLLNWTDDEEAIKVAARENQISLKKMKEAHQKMDILGVIIGDLERQNKRDESVKLANYIQDSLISTLNNNHKKIHDLGVKQALFYVLLGAKMPSVLAEVSFISNPEEEKLLSQESYRMEIAESIADGIDKYFISVPVIQEVADYRNISQH